MSKEEITIEHILKFASLLNDFQKVSRIVFVKDDARWENDVEHSYMLAMLADYIISSAKLNLNRELVMKYCLLHDMVEVYAGDTYIFTSDKALLDSKHDREQKALAKLKSDFPEYVDMWNLIDAYEARENEEAKFVYALDKLQPMIQIYLDNGRTWKNEKMNFGRLIENKDQKIKISPEIKKYWEEFRSILQNKKSELFSD